MAKVSEEVCRKLHARNTMVQLFALYTDPECYSTALLTDGWTDRRHHDANSRLYHVEVRSARKTSMPFKPLLGFTLS